MNNEESGVGTNRRLQLKEDDHPELSQGLSRRIGNGGMISFQLIKEELLRSTSRGP